VAKRSIPGWAMGLSLLATLISSVTFIAYPGSAARRWLEGYRLPATSLSDAAVNSFFPPGTSALTRFFHLHAPTAEKHVVVDVLRVAPGRTIACRPLRPRTPR